MKPLPTPLLWLISAVALGAPSPIQDAKRSDILRLIELTGDVNIEQARELFESGLDQTGTLPQTGT